MSKLESKIDKLKNLYIDWFIERMAIDHYYETGKKQLPPDSRFNFYHFIEWTVLVSDQMSPFHKIKLSTKKGAEIMASIEQLFHDRKADFIANRQMKYWQKLECPLVEVVQSG